MTPIAAFFQQVLRRCNAGNLVANVDRLILNRSGKIEAATKGGGGNIFLQTQLLQLRNLSQITTNASGNGNGGDISINSPMILGLENSDIVANAVQGRGGNISITTQGIIGLKFRDQLTPENDITASSEFGVNGTVEVKNFGVNPDSGLLELPVNIIDPNQQIAKGCDSNQGSSFVATGRGGVPHSPSQQVSIDRPWSDLRPIQSTTIATQPKPAQPLLEATTWTKNQRTGQIEIIAPQTVASQTSATCLKVTQF